MRRMVVTSEVPRAATRTPCTTRSSMVSVSRVVVVCRVSVLPRLAPISDGRARATTHKGVSRRVTRIRQPCRPQQLAWSTSACRLLPGHVE